MTKAEIDLTMKILTEQEIRAIRRVLEDFKRVRH